MKNNSTILQRLMLRIGVAGACLWITSVSCVIASAADNLPDNDISPGVSLPVAAGAVELFEKAKQKESEKQWKDASGLYDQILDRFASKVVLRQRDSLSGFYQYEGVFSAVQERMSKWPVDAIAEYLVPRTRLATSAPAGVSPQDSERLSKLFWRYFPTAAGKDAAIQRLDREIELGDFYAAGWTGQRLLTLHPLLGGDEAMTLYKTAMVSLWVGEDAQASAFAVQLHQKFPTEKGSIGGRNITLSEELSHAIDSSAATQPPRFINENAYPSFGGLRGCGEVSNATAQVYPPVIPVNFAALQYSSLSDAQRTAYQQLDQWELTHDTFLGVMPVADAGAVFFQDGRCVYAVDGNTGKPLSGWLDTYGGAAFGRYETHTPGRVRNEQLTLTVTPDAVFAVVGQHDGGRVGNAYAKPGHSSSTSTTKLVCLDRDNGKELWVKSPGELPEAAGASGGWRFSGTPLIVPGSPADKNGDSVLIAVHNSKSSGFDDCSIVSLSANSGHFQGRVLVMNNRGGIAAVDPEDGKILWFDAYQRDDKSAEVSNPYLYRYGEPFDYFNNGTRAWQYNPVIIDKNHLFALPADANTLFILNVITGELERELRMDELNNASVCLGVLDGAVCLTSDHDLYVVDWQKATRQKPLAGAIRWSEAGLTSEESNPICGRGFLSTQSIYIPTRRRIYQLSWDKQRIASVYPPSGAFSAQEGGGNLLVASHRLIVAQSQQIGLYASSPSSH